MRSAELELRAKGAAGLHDTGAGAVLVSFGTFIRLILCGTHAYINHHALERPVLDKSAPHALHVVMGA